MSMERLENTHLVLLLDSISGIGEHAMSAILRRNAVLRRSPEEFLALPVQTLRSDYSLKLHVARQVAAIDGRQRDAAVAMARHLRRHGVVQLTLLDALYPRRLLQRLDPPPPVVYAYGRLDLLETPLFATANSNRADETFLAATDRAAETAMECGWWPVTGHNRVGYQRPALAARRRGGRVCYVLDRGILEAFGGDLSRELFPAARIWSGAYDPACDLTLTCYAPCDHMLAVHNRRRDQILFALADIVFAGDVRPGGQMAGLCADAQARGIPVFQCRMGGDGGVLVARNGEHVDLPVALRRPVDPGGGTNA